jgi:hypothetical protein
VGCAGANVDEDCVGRGEGKERVDDVVGAFDVDFVAAEPFAAGGGGDRFGVGEVAGIGDAGCRFCRFGIGMLWF